jgi:hypothetical protein
MKSPGDCHGKAAGRAIIRHAWPTFALRCYPRLPVSKPAFIVLQWIGLDQDFSRRAYASTLADSFRFIS